MDSTITLPYWLFVLITLFAAFMVLFVTPAVAVITEDLRALVRRDATASSGDAVAESR